MTTPGTPGVATANADAADHDGASSEWRVGWQPAVAAALGYAAGTPLLIQLPSLFLTPIREETGWSATQSLISPITVGLCAVFSPLVGRAVDHFGPRRVAMTGQLLVITVIVVFASAPLSLAGYYAFGALTGIFGSLAYFVPFNRVIASWFHQGAGKAFATLGIAAAVVAFGATPLITTAIYAWGWGWRGGYLVLAAIMLVVGVIPVMLALRNKPAEATAGQAGPGPSPAHITAPEKPGAPRGSEPERDRPMTTVSRALRSGSLWGLGLSMFLMAVPLSGFLANLQPIMLSSGLSLERATTITSLFFLAVMFGRLGGGILLDTMSRYYAVFISFAISAVGALILGNVAPIAFGVALLATIFIAFSQGAEGDFLSYFVQKEFGTASFAVAFGTILPMFLAGGILGPYLFARLHDLTGSYHIAFNIGSALYLCSALAILIRLVVRRRRGASVDREVDVAA